MTLVWSWSKCDDTPPRPSSLVVLMFYFVVDIGERREEEGGGRRGEWRRSKRCLSFIFFPFFLHLMLRHIYAPLLKACYSSEWSILSEKSTWRVLCYAPLVSLDWRERGGRRLQVDAYLVNRAGRDDVDIYPFQAQ